MTETEKKGLDYLNQKISEGQTNIVLIIGELLEQLEKQNNIINN